MNTREVEIVEQAVSQLVGLKCWYVSCGGPVGSSFQLAFGERIPRTRQLRNKAHSDEFDRFEGEVQLLVWCTWRLDNEQEPISSSDDTEQSFTSALRGLVGFEVQSVRVERPGWDLQIEFKPYRRLRVLCDHVPGDPSLDGNWDLSTREHNFYIGPGIQVETTPREI